MTSLSPDDYDAIESAVMETARGRWFLAEYARRNRHADTEMLLDAIERLARVGAPAEDKPAEPAALVAAICETKAEIIALAPEDAAGDAFELMVSGAERAAVEMLAAAEGIQDAAWTAREHGFDPDQCDALDAGAAAIYAALARKDLAAQRIRKAVALLHRIEAMIGAPVMADDIGMLDIAAEDMPELLSAVALAFEDEGGQELGEEEPFPELAVAEPEMNNAPLGSQPILIDSATVVAPLAASASELEQDEALPLDPLAAVRAMSDRERMQLFS